MHSFSISFKNTRQHGVILVLLSNMELLILVLLLILVYLECYVVITFLIFKRERQINIALVSGRLDE